MMFPDDPEPKAAIAASLACWIASAVSSLTGAIPVAGLLLVNSCVLMGDCDVCFRFGLLATSVPEKPADGCPVWGGLVLLQSLMKPEPPAQPSVPDVARFLDHRTGEECDCGRGEDQ